MWRTACSLLILLIVGRGLDATEEVQVDFLKSIRPILSEHCADCHSADEQNGGLNFEAPSTVFGEANSGARAIVAGDPEKSELVRRVASSDGELQMPPDGDRLTEDQIELLKRWIAAGAHWSDGDESPPPPVTTSHWSFQPIGDPIVPEVRDSSWPLNAIDRFIQAERENVGLAVVQAADPVTLIRRAYYGLTGLPPTPAEIRQFQADAASTDDVATAFTVVVDRLLNQPAYGQRWGRHWMDWVRYADTAGDNSDFPVPQAYLYRNYIVDSFNADLPCDRFLMEQLAGDLLPADSLEQRNRQTIATGYLAMARRFGSLLERYPWHLTIEDTIDNMGRTMMGLTLSCARCHDHKFDPISTRDYYGLYGIFASTKYPFPGIELFQTQRDLVPLIPEEKFRAATRPYQATTDQLADELERLLAACERQAVKNAEREPQATLSEQRKMRDELDAMLLKARKAGEKLAEHLKTIPDFPMAYAVQEAEPINARIQLKGEPTRPGAEVPRKFPDVLGAQHLPEHVADTGSGRLELAKWIVSPGNPLTARVIVNRVWQRHFGEGLVASTSDFGLRGEQPSHPALLDWLAGEFIRSGWSLKQLHRMIMTSRSYQLASVDIEDNLARDPGNRYYWKFNRQRLDAESIRDTLLLVAGNLDVSPQSEPYPIPPQSKWEYTQHHPFKDDYHSNKRSVYLMTKRLTAKPYFQTFDGPDPNVCTSDRDQSVTPLQALFFSNDEFLHAQAGRFAELLLEQCDGEGPGHVEERAKRAFARILCRRPTRTELDLMLKHIATVEAKLRRESLDAGDASRRIVVETWASLARSLMRLNEFVYVD